MKKRKMVALIMAVVLTASSVFPVYAETIESTEMNADSLETEESIQTEMETEETELKETESQMPEETNESRETAETVETVNESIEDITYEVREAYAESGEIFSGDRQVIRIGLNSTEKILDATLKGFAEDKGAEVQYKLTSIEEDRLVLKLIMQETRQTGMF